MLPLELRSKPPREDFVKKWLHCKKVPRKLATMEAVWGGIEGLRFNFDSIEIVKCSISPREMSYSERQTNLLFPVLSVVVRGWLNLNNR